MAWRIEQLPAVAGDLDLILDHAYEIQLQNGHAPDEALAIAIRRLDAVRAAQERLARAPHIGTLHVVGTATFRHVTLDRFVFWFSLDAEREVVTIEGVFHGGQDHLGRMLARLEAEGGDG